ncbi:MAG: SIR2 family protein [Limisphaerales bacterium]
MANLEEQDRVAFQAELRTGNLESGLSRIRRVAALLGEDQELNGLTKARAKELDKLVCGKIAGELGLDNADLGPARTLAAWAGRSRYSKPVEIFTVNYDLLMETAFEAQKVPYFDGFLGTMRGNFHTELVENDGEDQVPTFFVRLWKLHGSVNWLSLDGEGGTSRRIVRVGSNLKQEDVAAIYPSDEKYEESRRVPFLVLQDRFRRSLNDPETLALISGYSFGDSHLNELIYDAASRRERSEYVAFVYDEIPNELAERAAHTPNLQVLSAKEAIIGGVRANWQTPSVVAPNVWVDDSFGLRDFRHLSRYLGRISKDKDVEAE